MERSKEPEVISDAIENMVVEGIPFRDIRIAPDIFQIRMKMREDIVHDYMTKYLNGVDMPPVTVGKLKDVYYLIDGFHRMSALKRLHKEDEPVQATVIPIKNVDEGRWIAVKANGANGLPLTSKDKAIAFDVFIKAKRYLSDDKKKKYKSIREIAREFGMWSHVTVGNKLKSCYPAIYAKMSTEPRNLDAEPPEDDKYFKSITQENLDHIEEVYKQINALSKSGRKQIKKACLKLIQSIDEFKEEQKDILEDSKTLSLTTEEKDALISKRAEETKVFLDEEDPKIDDKIESIKRDLEYKIYTDKDLDF